MKRILLTLLGVSALCVGGFLAANQFSSSGMQRAADQFLHAYSSGDAEALGAATTPEYSHTGVGVQQKILRDAVLRQLGAFAEIEKTLVERTYKLGPAQLGDYQCLARFAKGTAIVHLGLVDLMGTWRVSRSDISIPPSLMALTPEQTAESFTLHLVKLWTEGNAAIVRNMGSDAFRDKVSQSMLEQVMQPLLEARGKLTSLGIVSSEPVAANERDVRVLAEFDDGDALGFDMILRWIGNKWHANDLRVADAPGESLPESARRRPDEFGAPKGAPHSGDR